MLRNRLLIGLLTFGLMMGLLLACSSAKQQTKERTKKKEEKRAKEKEQTEEASKKKEDIKYGLTVKKRKEIYDQVNMIQDKVSPDDPQYNKKMQEAYSAVARRYDLPEDVVRQIAIEGATKQWFAPPE